MIATSLLLIAGAIMLLVLGLWQSSSALLGASIAASLLAAVVLVLSARRTAAGPVPASTGDRGGPGRRGDTDRRGDTEQFPAMRTPAEQYPAAAGTPARVDHGAAAEQVTTAIPSQPAPPQETAEVADEHEVDPPDEPAPQQVSTADAARVGRMLTEVLVVDGRPRYHLPGCVHLLGRESEPLPVGEAIELGFTPCSLCEPDSALLADARRV